MDVEAIQQTLRRDGIDGWLFADFRGSDPLAAAILDLPAGHRSRRWFYYVPAQGHPTRIVHAIETGALDALPGRLQVYLPWQQLHELLRGVVAGAKKSGDAVLAPEQHSVRRAGGRWHGRPHPLIRG